MGSEATPDASSVNGPSGWPKCPWGVAKRPSVPIGSVGGGFNAHSTKSSSADRAQREHQKLDAQNWEDGA